MHIKNFYMKSNRSSSGKKICTWSFALIFFSLLIPPSLLAQSHAVKGKVIGIDGRGIDAVSIIQKGTTNGTTTIADGTFTLAVSNPNATLEISSLGYESQEIALNGRNELTITLQGSVAKELEQVVVVGYGTANKRDLTGSIVKISGKEIADKPNTNPVASLQGKVAGLSVVNNGTPGSAPDIRIRGTVSIGQVHPLYVVDGIFNDNIDYLNPNDIESIEILKDPSSLAIFGVKGATGVIAVTTKSAKAGQVLVNFNTSYGFKKLVDKIKFADADLFKTLFAEENVNIGNLNPIDYTGMTANTDWIDAVTRTGNFSSNNLSVSGSTDKNKFHLGLGYIYDEGIIIRQKLEKMLLSFRDEFKINKNIKVGLNLNVERQKLPYGVDWALDVARKVMPQISAGTKPFKIKDPYNPDSITVDLYSGLNLALQNSGVVNPLVQIENEWDKTINTEFRTVGSVYGEISFLKDFTFRSTFYADRSNLNSRQYTPIYSAYNPINNTPYIYSQSTQVQENYNTWEKYQQDHILTYKSSFGDHNLAATGGFTTYYFANQNRHASVKQSLTGNPIPDDPRFWYISNGFVTDQSLFGSNSSQSEYSTVSLLARAIYNFQNKYYFNASVRNDASSQISPDHRNQIFWAVGAAWDLSRESFMENQQIFDFLKIKGSIGVLGNQSTYGYAYPFYPGLSSGDNANAVFGTTVYNAYSQAYLPDRNLKWETVHAREVGVEMNMLQNKLHFEANYFNKTTKDLMVYIQGTGGVSDGLTNSGSLRNSGFEFSASYTQNVSKDLKLNIGGNLTTYKNKVLDLPESAAIGNSGTSRTSVGMPIGYFYGYVVDGIFQSYADVLKSPNQGALGSYGPGDFKYKDVTGDGKVTVEDRTMIGNPTPDFTYGASIGLDYKGFNLSIDVGGVYGNEIFRNWGSLESPFQRVNYPEFKKDRWHGPGTSNWDPVLNQGNRINYLASTYSIEDGSYFRIRNAQLGYNFSHELISGIGIKSLRVYANVQNPKTWKNNYGYTTEFGGSATSFGYDNGGGAIPMVTTFGLNVTF